MNVRRRLHVLTANICQGDDYERYSKMYNKEEEEEMRRRKMVKDKKEKQQKATSSMFNAFYALIK